MQPVRRSDQAERAAERGESPKHQDRRGSAKTIGHEPVRQVVRPANRDRTAFQDPRESNESRVADGHHHKQERKQ